MSKQFARDQFNMLLCYPKQPSEKGLKHDTAATNFRSYASTLVDDDTPVPAFEKGVLDGCFGNAVPSDVTYAQATAIVNKHFHVWWEWHEQARGGN